MKIDWKKMGFGSEQDYHKFMEEKLRALKAKLQEPEIKAVMKRLADR